jgi:capsular polysaccharide transport system permease protein
MDAAVRESAGTDVGTETQAGRQTGEALNQRLWRCVKRHHLFLLTVALPTLVATVYYGFIASDIYVSVSQFVIHSPQQTTPTGGILGEFLAGAGVSRSENAGYAVEAYVASRDALRELDAKLNLRKVFGSPDVDIFDRFPGLHRDDSFEKFYRYFGKHVGVTYDPGTSISILTVSAYTPRSAYKINNLLLSMSERLVNSLNERSREDMIRYAERDVDVAEQKATQASLALLAYRSKHAVFAPDKQAAIELEGIARLQAELITTEAELAQLKQLSPDNPQIPGLRSRAETLRTAIAGQASKVTGASGSLSARAPEFEQLALESTIADKELGAALAELDSVRRDAARQQLYLERLVQPSLPDDSLLPRRFRSILTVLIVGLILWGVLSLVLASIHEHTE